jgi:hypothetical protein
VGIGGNELVGLLVMLAIAALIFLVLREFWCWYFKLNAILETLREIRDQLKSRA